MKNNLKQKIKIKYGILLTLAIVQHSAVSCASVHSLHQLTRHKAKHKHVWHVIAYLQPSFNAAQNRWRVATLRVHHLRTVLSRNRSVVLSLCIFHALRTLQTQLVLNQSKLRWLFYILYFSNACECACACASVSVCMCVCDVFHLLLTLQFELIFN
jgi:hypothetical protein